MHVCRNGWIANVVMASLWVLIYIILACTVRVKQIDHPPALAPK
jgi:hypothetical protein